MAVAREYTLARSRNIVANQGKTVADSWDLQQHTATSLWQQCGRQFAAAVVSARHPFHLLTVATVADGETPDQRTVVLRNFDPTACELAFHTDIRSAKAGQLAACRQVSLHWYDPTARVQLRIPATATLHHGDPRAAAAWAGSRATSRACYTAINPPGAAVDAFPAAPSIPLDDDDRGLVHFAVVVCRFTTVEVLSLHATGHQRVQLHLTSDPISWQLLAP